MRGEGARGVSSSVCRDIEGDKGAVGDNLLKYVEELRQGREIMGSRFEMYRGADTSGKKRKGRGQNSLKGCVFGNQPFCSSPSAIKKG